MSGSCGTKRNIPIDGLPKNIQKERKSYHICIVITILGMILSPIIYRGEPKIRAFVETIDESGRGQYGQEKNDILDGR